MFHKVQEQSRQHYDRNVSRPPVPDASTPRSRAAMVAAASRVLAREPSRSLGEVAAALGVGRTTLHRMFPTRADLLRAVADDALADLATVYADAGLGASAEPDHVVDGVRQVVGDLVPRGAALLFLLRVPELADDADLARRVAELDEPLHEALRVAQRGGAVRADVPAWWLAETLLAAVYVAWEQIEAGRLAPLDAPDLVVRTWCEGAAARD